MCGICGQVNLRGNARVEPDAVRKMASSISHRGPDDEGFFFSGPVGFGFRRLSIIDLEGGHQPMSDDEGSVWIAFNGEIYNFQELRKELEASGHRFKTRSDTEVIVHGYKEWGVDVLNHLNGMFGLAVWDCKKKELMLARDRMGIKPLYYRIENGVLLFGSEVRAILSQLRERPEPDTLAMYLFLRYRYTPSPLTLFKGIRKLAPGTRLIVRGSKTVLERWWDFKPAPFNPMPDENEAREELLSLYRRSVKRHLISDVPLGILLSGGLDSGLLLALMKEHGDGWKTYTAGFGNNFDGDETGLGRKTAEAFDMPNVSVELGRESFEQTLSRFISILEEPVTASSIVPMYHLCKRAREDVKVAMMGQGPDELFGGYKRHLGVHYGRYWRALPEWMRGLSSSVLARMPRSEMIKRGLSSLDKPERLERYNHVFSVIPGPVGARLFKEGVLPDNAEESIKECWRDLYPLMEDTDELGGLQFLEIRSSLPDELLLYADKLSMAHGLEIRVPYLDKEIVEFAERLKPSYKIRDGKGKWLHRQVCHSFMPKEITGRKKLGFATPVDEWLRDIAGGMGELLRGRDSLVYGYLKPETVHRLQEDHTRGISDNSKILFSIIVLEEWLRAYAV